MVPILILKHASVHKNWLNPGAAGWKAQKNPLIYGGIHSYLYYAAPIVMLIHTYIGMRTETCYAKSMELENSNEAY